MMGQDVLNEASFIGVVGDNAMIRFLRKRWLSISTTHVIQTRAQGDKRLEV
jgi:hypothetical protein